MKWKAAPAVVIALALGLSFVSLGTTPNPPGLIPPTPTAAPSPTPTPLPEIARGKIAFSLFNAERQAYEVHIVSLDTKERWLLTGESVSEPQLSPDGQHVAVRGWDKYGGIETFDLYGQDRQIISKWREDARVDWTTGHAFAWGSQRETDRRWRLYVNDQVLKWDRQVIFGESPSWSPLGLWIVYRGCDFSTRNCGLRTVGHEGRPMNILTIEDTDASPVWGPDGSTIVFMSKRSGNWDLYKVQAQADGTLAKGSEPTALTHDPSNEGLPAWSPWGNAVAFVSDRTGAWAVYIMRLDGTDVRKVVDIGGTYDTPPLTRYAGRGFTDEQISWSR